MTDLALRNVEVDGRIVDVTITDGRIDRAGHNLPARPAAAVVDGEGGALLPGLWDHHIHLVALAAARRSVTVGPPVVTDIRTLADTLARHRPNDTTSWLRGVGYHESVAGLLDRHQIDRLLPGVPVRIQHRSGALWILSSEAIHRLDIDHERREGLERNDQDQLTGRLYGDDRWLRTRLGAIAPEPPPDLAAIGHELASYGVVGVTDATPYENVDDLRLLAEAASTGALPQHVIATGGPTLADAPFPAALQRGPVKLRLADHALPTLDQIVGWITTAHSAGRPIAVHCVTRVSLILTLAALDDAGSVPGDRIEHGAVIPPQLHHHLRRHQLTIVTQPNLIAERGDQYLTDVDPADQPHLYPCASLLRASIRVAGSTDAPFGHPDPWRAIGAAVERRTARGESVGASEAVEPHTGLDLFLGAPDAPGGPVRQVRPNAAADLCLLHTSLAEALRGPVRGRVRATLIRGHWLAQSTR